MRSVVCWPVATLFLFCFCLLCLFSLRLASAGILNTHDMFASRSDVASGAGAPLKATGLVVREHTLNRSARPGFPDITIRYPSLGQQYVDQDITVWVEHIAATFEQDFASKQAIYLPYWLNGEYEVSATSQKAVSVIFTLWIDTGGPQPNQDVITLNYNVATGQRLGILDIFEDPLKALAILSDTSRELLARGIGRGRVDQNILSGTEPRIENFASLAFLPSGLRVYFQPMQVANWSFGVQYVDIPLERLLPAGPVRSLWE